MVIVISHNGHFGTKKMFPCISQHFIWPNLWKDVKSYVKTCAGCQKAVLQPLPCVSEPFQKVTFDTVGPLPHTAKGNRYAYHDLSVY